MDEKPNTKHQTPNTNKPNTKHQTPNTTNKGPENLGDILGRLFTSRGWGRKNDRVRLETAWKSAAAEFLADTAVLGLKRGVLEVAVRNAVLLQELTQFHKRGLLTKLRAALPGVTLTDLKFRAAAW